MKDFKEHLKEMGTPVPPKKRNRAELKTRDMSLKIRNRI
jgi:hypothetical protein